MLMRLGMRIRHENMMIDIQNNRSPVCVNRLMSTLKPWCRFKLLRFSLMTRASLIFLFVQCSSLVDLQLLLMRCYGASWTHGLPNHWKYPCYSFIFCHPRMNSPPGLSHMLFSTFTRNRVYYPFDVILVSWIFDLHWELPQCMTCLENHSYIEIFGNFLNLLTDASDIGQE